MVEWIETLEIADADGKGTGKYRKTRRTDDPVTGPFGLCEHEHDTREEAAACPDASRRWPIDQASGKVDGPFYGPEDCQKFEVAEHGSPHHRDMLPKTVALRGEDGTVVWYERR